MTSYLRDLQRSFIIKFSRAFLKGGEKRRLQEQLDVHKLFLYTSFQAQRQESLNQGQTDDLTTHLINQAQQLPFKEQKQVVQDNLFRQLCNVGNVVHNCLLQEQDCMPSAAALEQCWHSMQQQQQQAHPSHGLSVGSPNSSERQQQDNINSAPVRKQLVPQLQLSQLVQQQLGYSLSVQPSQIQHKDAGMGLFVEGNVPAGSLVALFPGLVYGKEAYRRMPGYPRMDIDNPYLTARYDGRIVDSRPWGGGWRADGTWQNTVAAPRKLGLLGRITSGSDGMRAPVPDTTWVKATTGEAAALEMLEGRHPLALAHFANHPAPGTTPNTIIASFTFTPAGCRSLDSSTAGSGRRSESSSPEAEGSCRVHQAPPAYLRAYVPNITYQFQCNHRDLLEQAVYCIGLVAVDTLPHGTEVLFNYRLSPSVMGRPQWYVPLDEKEERMRWA